MKKNSIVLDYSFDDKNDHEMLALKSSASAKKKFIISITIMIICGSCTDFLGKAAYQSLPESNLLKYWATLFLTFGTFLICSFGLIPGHKSFKLLTKKSFFKITILAFLHLCVTGGRYLALIFLPASIISILKNGFQLIFLALFRRIWRKKKLTYLQWFGLLITLIGLCLVSCEDILYVITDDNSSLLYQTLLGITLLFIVGFLGAVRNTIEEVLLQDEHFSSNFILGFEAVISCFLVLIIGIIYSQYLAGGDKYSYLLGSRIFIIFFVLFLAIVYGKDVTQLKVAKLTSSVVRKLFRQLSPSITWIISLTTYYGISSLYGETWEKYSWIRAIGFIIILSGTYIYVKPPKSNVNITKDEKDELPTLAAQDSVVNQIKIEMFVSEKDEKIILP